MHLVLFRICKYEINVTIKQNSEKDRNKNIRSHNKIKNIDNFGINYSKFRVFVILNQMLHHPIAEGKHAIYAVTEMTEIYGHYARINQKREELRRKHDDVKRAENAGSRIPPPVSSLPQKGMFGHICILSPPKSYLPKRPGRGENGVAPSAITSFVIWEILNIPS